MKKILWLLLVMVAFSSPAMACPKGEGWMGADAKNPMERKGTEMLFAGNDKSQSKAKSSDELNPGKKKGLEKQDQKAKDEEKAKAGKPSKDGKTGKENKSGKDSKKDGKSAKPVKPDPEYEDEDQES